jgi:pyrimidine-specific ribonucleoside hydrolase
VSRSGWVLTCDPGIDDAIALAVLAGRGDGGVQAIVAGAGNVDAPTAWRNSTGLAALFGLDVPVHLGSATARGGAPIHRSGHVHGTDGLAGLSDRLAARPNRLAARPDHEAGSPTTTLATWGNVLATGPLTDVALALRSHRSLDRLVWMGGALVPDALVPGAADIVGTIEFNAAADPVAVVEVLASPAVEVDIVPLDITRQVRLTAPDLTRWSTGPPPAQFCAALARTRLVDDVMTPHDAVAAVAALDPDLFRWRRLHVRPSPDDLDPRGALRVDRSLDASPNARVAIDVDASAVTRTIVESVSTLRP